jgi:hypothetical protein
MYYPGISLKELRKTTKNLSEDSRTLDRDLNTWFPEYEEGITLSQPSSLNGISPIAYTPVDTE